MLKIKGMIDVGEKDKTKRIARASAFVKLDSDILKRIEHKEMPKGDVLETAKIAGILAAKRTDELIPLCHPIETDSVQLDFSIQADGIAVEAMAKATAKTGVEMEALVAASTAALTIYDMSKMFSKTIEITGIQLLEKRGGKTGDYLRSESV